MLQIAVRDSLWVLKQLSVLTSFLSMQPVNYSHMPSMHHQLIEVLTTKHQLDHVPEGHPLH
jgi:hypothetical protein